MQITKVVIDLAKNVIQTHGANERGKAVVRRQLRRNQVVPFFVNLPPCLIRMEACGSAHHWERKLQALGHQVRLMAPQSEAVGQRGAFVAFSWPQEPPTFPADAGPQ